MRNALLALALSLSLAAIALADGITSGAVGGNGIMKKPNPTATPTPTPTATPFVCNELTNCNDICNGNGEELQPRHCFKGNCVLDTIIDCADTLQSCKEGVPDDYCS